MKRPEVDWNRWRLVLRAMFWDSLPASALGLFLGMTANGTLLAKPSAELLTIERALYVLAVVVAASVAVLAKRNDQAAYGSAELFFGIAFAWNVASKQLGTDPVTNGVTTLAVVYLCSRGLQNLLDGAEKNLSNR
jgi:hypothetical protein